MRSKFELTRNGLIGVLVGFVTVALVSGVVVYASSQLSFREEVVKLTSDIAARSLLSEQGSDAAFGSSGLTSTATPSLFSGFNQINVSDVMRFGDSNTFQDEGIARYLRVIDFTRGTTTPVTFQNTFGETIYLREVAVQLSGKPTTTARMALTTSSAAVLAADDVTILNGDASGRLMDGFGDINSSAIPTSTVLWLRHYAGTDGRDYPIPIEPGVYIHLFATSTLANNNQAILDTNSYFDGEVYLMFETVD